MVAAAVHRHLFASRRAFRCRHHPRARTVTPIGTGSSSTDASDDDALPSSLLGAAAAAVVEVEEQVPKMSYSAEELEGMTEEEQMQILLAISQESTFTSPPPPPPPLVAPATPLTQRHAESDEMMRPRGPCDLCGCALVDDAWKLSVSEETNGIDDDLSQPAVPVVLSDVCGHRFCTMRPGLCREARHESTSAPRLPGFSQEQRYR